MNKSNYGSRPQAQAQVKQTSSVKPAAAGGKVHAPYNLTFSIGDELVRLTGLFSNKSKAGNDYLGAKKIRPEDVSKLIEILQNASSEGTEIGVFVFENKPKA